jgi:hypothetical protein
MIPKPGATIYAQTNPLTLFLHRNDIPKCANARLKKRGFTASGDEEYAWRQDQLDCQMQKPHLVAGHTKVNLHHSVLLIFTHNTHRSLLQTWLHLSPT